MCKCIFVGVSINGIFLDVGHPTTTVWLSVDGRCNSLGHGSMRNGDLLWANLANAILETLMVIGNRFVWQ